MTKIVGPAILYTPKIPNMKSWISQWFYNPFGKMTMEHKPEQIRTGSAPDCDRGNVWFCFECIPFSNGNTFRIPDHFWKEDLNLCVDSKPAFVVNICERAARLLIHTVHICTCFHNFDAQWYHASTQRHCVSWQIIMFALNKLRTWIWNTINMPNCWTLFFHASIKTWIRCRFPSLQT